MFGLSKFFTKVLTSLGNIETLLREISKKLGPTRVTMIAQERVDIPDTQPVPLPKPEVSKKEAKERLEAYEKEFTSFRATQPNNQNVGSEIEYLEKSGVKGKPNRKTEEFRGVAAIEAFIARAKKGEVRIVRQIR
jgi:hypothetical protein